MIKPQPVLNPPPGPNRNYNLDVNQASVRLGELDPDLNRRARHNFIMDPNYRTSDSSS
jgi:hypothetical protein